MKALAFCKYISGIICISFPIDALYKSMRRIAEVWWEIRLEREGHLLVVVSEKIIHFRARRKVRETVSRYRQMSSVSYNLSTVMIARRKAVCLIGEQIGVTKIFCSA